MCPTAAKGHWRGQNTTKTARLWLYARKEDTWVSETPPAVWEQFKLDRKVVLQKTNWYLSSL
jgi:hypothetical protein